MIVRSDSAQTNSTRREYFVASRVLTIEWNPCWRTAFLKRQLRGLNEQLR